MEFCSSFSRFLFGDSSSFDFNLQACLNSIKKTSTSINNSSIFRWNLQRLHWIRQVFSPSRHNFRHFLVPIFLISVLFWFPLTYYVLFRHKKFSLPTWTAGHKLIVKFERAKLSRIQRMKVSTWKIVGIR
jgi:hypothetical protein